MGIHCKLIGKDNGAANYPMKEETRVDGPVVYGKVNGGDRKSAKW